MANPNLQLLTDAAKLLDPILGSENWFLSVAAPQR